MTDTDLRDRLRQIVVKPNEVASVAFGAELLQGAERPPIPAAVLVPFVLGAAPAVLLTKRNEKLRRHAGQVSFPGGRIDPGDASPIAAALREAQEEVGIDPGAVEVVGLLADFLTGTGFRITPVIGLIPPGLTLRPDPVEVESAFHFPLSVLLDPRAPRREHQERNGIRREIWVWPHPEHYIWGATAAILVHVAEKLRRLS